MLICNSFVAKYFEYLKQKDKNPFKNVSPSKEINLKKYYV